MSEKVALFGGTFNPPHPGHARAFRTFCEKVCPDVVYVMPASVPPHKEISGIVNPAARFHMAHLALDDISENAVFSALEISRRGKSFSVDTVNELLSLHDCDKIYMYVGSDMLFYFEKWKDFQILFEKCVLVTAPRCEADREAVEKCCREYAEKYHCQYMILPLLPIEVSSTEIRDMAKKGNESEIKKHLTDGVYRYIMKTKLYGEKNLCSDISSPDLIENIRSSLALYLSQKRMAHTLSVEKTALEMAQIFLPLFGYGEEYHRDVAAAALLHDITKNRPDEWHESYLSSFMRNFGNHPSVIHSWSGAYFALENFFVNPRVFRAIFNHTTGCADMDVFEKLIFLADYIEPGRVHSSCVLLREKYLNLTKDGVSDREHAEKILDSLVYRSLCDTLAFLTEKGANICPKLFEAKEYLEKKECVRI